MSPPEPASPRLPVPSDAPTPERRAVASGPKMLESSNQDGWLMAVELVTATLTWGGIGYLVDRFWLGTTPWFMSIGFVVGFFAGMYLLWLKTNAPEEQPDAAGARAKDGADV